MLSFEYISKFGSTFLADKYMNRSYTWTDLEITVNQMSNAVLFHLQTPLYILFPKVILKVRKIQQGRPQAKQLDVCSSNNWYSKAGASQVSASPG